MKLVLFCDYGLDDAAATVDALLHAQKDGYDEAELVAVGGNVPADVALVNAKKLVANLNFPHLPVKIVDTSMIGQPAEYLKEIHGGDGMGDLFEEHEPPCETVPFSAWQKEGGEFDLLSLGPMTLVPFALGKKPRKFVFMGGNIAEEPNFRGYEFNHALNRAAFSECVKYPHVAITMDTCRHPLLNLREEEIGDGDLMHRIVNRAREMTFRSGEKGCYIWDDIAVKYLRHPDWFDVFQRSDRDGNLLSVASYVYGKKYLEIIGE